jgi:hypothetical protein
VRAVPHLHRDWAHCSHLHGCELSAVRMSGVAPRFARLHHVVLGCTMLCSVAQRCARLHHGCVVPLAGLRTLVQRECSHFLRIPPAAASPSEIDSLNVSVAAGILLHSLLTRSNALAPSG